MATPHVTGAAALYIANNPNATVVDVRAWLEGPASRPNASQYGFTGDPDPIDEGVLYLGRAYQMIQFRLDKSGADLASVSEAMVASGPRDFHFDRPYLITMARRGAEHPYFAMWVDNDELMAR